MPRYIDKRKVALACIAWLLPALVVADVVIGIVEDGPLPRPIIPLGTLEAEILDLVGDEFSVSLPASKHVDGGWTLDGVRDALARQLADPDVDIVINNAIVLLDRIRIEQEENGLAADQAIIEAAQQRLRPILLTTATTVGGLIPLWLGGGPMWEPMAIAIIFGLLFATVLTLGVVPVLYSLMFRVRFGVRVCERSP